MKLEYELKTDPLDYLIIDDLLAEELMDDIRSWVKSMDLRDPEYTGSAYTERGVSLKQNRGAFSSNDTLFDKVMMTVLSSLGDEGNIEGLRESPFFYSLFLKKEGNKTANQMMFAFTRSYLSAVYDDGDHYKSHPDATIVSALFWLDDAGADFTGGDLTFTDYNETVKYRHNRLVLFFGPHRHEVDAVKGNGRICVSTFFNPPNSFDVGGSAPVPNGWEHQQGGQSWLSEEKA